MQTPPPAYDQAPLGAPPGAYRDPRSPAARYATLGTTCLVLAAVQLLYSVQKIVSSSMSGSMVNIQRSLMPTLPGAAGPAPTGKIFDAAQDFAARIAMWEIARILPFVVASGVLVWIGVRLRSGDASALATARRWVGGAFAVLAVSLLVQVFVTIPATLEYMKVVVDVIPAMPKGGAAPPFDVKGMTSQVTIVATIIGTVFGTLVMSAWPIVLYFWSRKLTRETLPRA